MDVKKSEQLGSSCDDSVNDTEKSSDVKTNKGKPTFDFNERTFKEDITLVVEGEKLYVSKSVLASASPVFDRMFHSDFKEKDLTEFNLPGKRVSEMQEFLRFIYSERSVDVSDVNVYKLLPLAEEYHVASMKAKCEEFFISRLNNVLDASDFKNILQIAANYNMDDLLDKFCENIPEQFVRDLISEELPNRIVKKILDKMMERLEHIRKRNMWLEGIHKYSKSGQSRVVQKDFERDLREYKNWKCQSLYFQLNVDDLMKDQVPQTKQFKFLETDDLFKISFYKKGDGYYNDPSLYLEIEFGEDTIKQTKVKIHGRFVIRNTIDAVDSYKSTFQLEFKPAELKQSAIMKDGYRVFDVRAGYLYYEFAVAEIHLLAKTEEI